MRTEELVGFVFNGVAVFILEFWSHHVCWNTERMPRLTALLKLYLKDPVIAPCQHLWFLFMGYTEDTFKSLCHRHHQVTDISRVANVKCLDQAMVSKEAK